MKFIALTSSAILAIVLVIPVSAVALDILESRAIAAAPSAAAQTVINYISDASHKSSINPVCFFSGQTKVSKVIKGKTYTSTKSAESALADFKGSPRNCHVIAEIIADAKVQSSGFTSNDWKQVSKALAEHVSGKTYVILGQEVRSNSVWVTDEKPALKKNGKVDLEVWEIETSGSVVKTSKTRATV